MSVPQARVLAYLRSIDPAQPVNVRTIADATGYARKSVEYVLKKLVAAGVVELTELEDERVSHWYSAAETDKAKP